MSLFSSTQIMSIDQRIISYTGYRPGTAQLRLSPSLYLGVILVLVLLLTAVSLAAVQLQPSPDRPGDHLGDNHDQLRLVGSEPSLSTDVMARGVMVVTDKRGNV